MRLTCRSLAISLEDVIGKHESDIINALLKCKKKFNRNFKVVFIHNKLKEKDIKEFINRHSNELIKINSEITKNIQYVWFNINLTDFNIKSWRYNYRGSDILFGIEKYIEILNHIEKRDNI